MMKMNTENLDYSVIIPIHNEENAITSLFFSLKDVMELLDASYEIIFIDDGSTDNSLKELRAIGDTSVNLAIIIFEHRFGKSEALQAGFENARGQTIVTLDGDGQDDPKDIPKLLHRLNEGCDIVYGWRYNRNDSFKKRIVSKIANGFRRITTRDQIHDVGCAMRVFRRDVLTNIRLFSGLHRFFSAIAIKLGYSVSEVKVQNHPRKHGTSKYGTLDRLFEGLYDFFRIQCLDINKLKNRAPKFKIKQIERT